MTKAAKKAPQSIYLNEIVHFRVSRLVENALDGHGSIAGFFAYLERKTFEAFGACKIDVQEDLPSVPRQLTDLEPLFLTGDTVPPDDQLTYYFRRHVTEWEESSASSKLDPAARHLLGLFMLRDHKHLWIAESFQDYVAKGELHPTRGALASTMAAGQRPLPCRAAMPLRQGQASRCGSN